MDPRITPSLDRLTLDNFDSKMEELHGVLERNVTQDLQQIRAKMGVCGNQAPEVRIGTFETFARDGIVESSEVEASGRGSGGGSQRSGGGQWGASGPVSEPEEVENYLQTSLMDSGINYPAVREVNAKKISVREWHEHVRCVLDIESWEKIRQLFDELIDLDDRVEVRQFIRRANKFSLAYIEATAVEVPLIKRNLPLKKVLFELGVKTGRMGEKIALDELVDAIEGYIHPEAPTIDLWMGEQTHRANYMHLPVRMVDELKSIYRRSTVDHFLSYCATRVLVSKVKYSEVFRGKLNTLVRPKSNYERAKSVADVLDYMRQRAPEYVDLDQFLLYFSAKGFTYYPVTEREIPEDDNEEEQQQRSPKIRRVKSERRVNLNTDRVGSDYLLSTNNPNSIRNQKLKQMVEKNQQRQQKQQRQAKFKARPVPKSHSKEKYDEFVSTINRKIALNRTQNLQRMHSQDSRVEKLKHTTKLFESPQHTPPPQQRYQVVARPVPQSTRRAAMEEIEQEKQERREKHLHEAEARYRSAWEDLPEVANRQLSPPHSQTHRPKVQGYAREVPDYRPQQLRMELELGQRKAQNTVTEPEEFFFCTARRHDNLVVKVPQPQSPVKPNYDYKDIIYAPEPDIYYTQKHQDMVEANKNRAIKRQKKDLQKAMEDQERYQKHANFARFMKKSLNRLPDTAKLCENEAREKIERHKKYWKNLDREHQNELNQIYGRILKRPFLYEMQSNHPTLRTTSSQKDLQPYKHSKKAKHKKPNKLYTGSSSNNGGYF